MAQCQYTGIELKSGRAKNAPEVAALLDKANRAGKYRDVQSAMLDAKAAGQTGQEVIGAGKLALKSGYTSARTDESVRSMTDIMENNE